MTLYDSITKHIVGKRPTETIQINVPIDACRMISRACATFGPQTGVKFMHAAAPYYVETNKEKPPSSEVMDEAMSNAREELEILNNERE